MGEVLAGSDVDNIRAFVVRLKDYLNRRQIMPRERWYLDKVLLALISKSITVAEAVLCLLSADFADEAFGVTRTLEDIFYTARYIANTDSESRARKYAQFVAKDSELWRSIIRDFYPTHLLKDYPVTPEFSKLAKNYPNPHRWAGKNTTARDFAYEADSTDVDDAGNPVTFVFDYRAIYRWTSHYVHPTMVCLRDHIAEDGVFRTHPNRTGRGIRNQTAFNTVIYLWLTLSYAFKAMNMEIPGDIVESSEALLKLISQGARTTMGE